MDERLYRLNTTYAVADTLICIVAVLAFTFCAWFFAKWWITLFNVLPLALFNTHMVVVDTANGKEEKNER